MITLIMVQKKFSSSSILLPELDYPKDKKRIPHEFLSDVVFAGHYENDQE